MNGNDSVLRERVRTVIENKYLTVTEKTDIIIDTIYQRGRELERMRKAEYL